jgi:hypothetical protein
LGYISLSSVVVHAFPVDKDLESFIFSLYLFKLLSRVLVIPQPEESPDIIVFLHLLDHKMQCAGADVEETLDMDVVAEHNKLGAVVFGESFNYLTELGGEHLVDV